MLAKFLVPALAAISTVSAQTSLCAAPTATINSQADASALAASCTVVQGSIVIPSSVAGSISLDGIQQIGGDLICNGATQLTGLSGNVLNAIGGQMNLQSLTILSTLGFPNLHSVGALYWLHLTGLQFLNWAAPGQPGLKKATSVYISDTQLNTLDGINLDTVGSMDINNNRFLNLFSTQVANITQSFNLQTNGNNLTVQFPNLIYAYNMTFTDTYSINMPSLQSVNTTLGFYGDHMANISLFNLTTVGGDLAFTNNDMLSKVSLPHLTTIGGGLVIVNNPQLGAIDGFGALQTAKSINMTGAFSHAQLPSLATDAGALYVVSTSPNLTATCNSFNSLHPSVVRGVVTCKPGSTVVAGGGITTASGTSAPAATSSSASASSSTKADFTNMIGMASLAAVFTVIGGAAGLAQLIL